MTKTEISPFAFYTALFLGRVFTVVTFIVNLKSNLAPTDFALSAVFMGVFLLLTSVPLFLLFRTDTSSSVITRAAAVSSAMGKIFCILYLFDFLFYGAMTAARFEILASSVMFPGKNMLYAVVLLLAVSAYGAYKGIETIGRTGVVFLVPVLLSFVFVFLSLLKNFEILNFSPVTVENTVSSASSAFIFSARTGELLFAAVLPSFIKKHKKHHIFIWSAVVSGTVVVTFVMIGGVLGNFGSLQLFSMYSMSVIAGFGLVSRMDAVITCIWMLCACIKLSVILFACDHILTNCFGSRIKKFFIPVCCAVMFVAALCLSSSIETFSLVMISPVVAIVYYSGSCLMPAAVLLGERIKK